MVIEIECECDQCSHSWKQPIIDFIQECLTDKQIKELIAILEDWLK